MLSCDFVVEVGNSIVAPQFDSDGGVTVLFGASGAGKTVTLKAMAGLVRPSRGSFHFGGRPLFDSERGIDIPPGDRTIGYVPQSLALFPHMSVAENVAFGIRGSRTERRQRVEMLLSRLGMADFESRSIRSLSGGQQQRVALARALARDARLLLLDEPFSALDESLRADFRRELLRMPTEFGLTVVFVTHDLREAHLLADRIAVFDEGRVLQFDTRENVFRRPESRRVAALTGVSNVRAGILRSKANGYVEVEVDGLLLRCAPMTRAAAPGSAVDVAIRAERVILRRGEAGGPNSFSAAIAEEFAYGSTHTLRLEPVGPGPSLEAELAARPYDVLGIAERRRWTVELPPEDLHVMPRPEGSNGEPERTER